MLFDVRFLASPKLIALPADRYRICFIDLVCEAKQQGREGVFASMAVVKYAAKHRRECIATLIDAGLLETVLCARCLTRFGLLPDGSVVIHDWQDYQEPSRTTQWREVKRRRNTGETQSETSNETGLKPLARASALSVSESVSLAETDGEENAVISRPLKAVSSYGQSDERDSLDTYHELTGWRPWRVFSGDKLRAAIRDYTDPSVDSALREEAAINGDRNSLLERTLTRLARNADREHEEKARRPRPPKPDAEAEYVRIKAIEAELVREATR